MAGSRMTDERAALEATRARLEAALTHDENWLALKQSRAEMAADQGPQRRVRDARLELVLLSNPVYRAWKHVDDAIEDLRKNEESPGGSSALASVHLVINENAAKQVTSLANLSRGIARLIQRGMPEADSEPALAKIAMLDAPAASRPPRIIVEEGPPPAAPHASELPPPAVAKARVEPAAEPVSLSVAAPEPALAMEPELEAPEVTKGTQAEPAPATDVAPEPKQERKPVPFPPLDDVMPAEIVKLTEAKPMAATPRPERDSGRILKPTVPGTPRRAAMPKEREMDDPHFGPDFEPEEATVTFVTRGPAPSRSPQAGRIAEPTARSRPAGDPIASGDHGNAPHLAGDPIEEAEVTIMTPEGRRELEETAQRDGNLRRFRKALLGD